MHPAISEDLATGLLFTTAPGSTVEDYRRGTFSLVERRNQRPGVGSLSEGHYHVPNGEHRQANIQPDRIQGRIGRPKDIAGHTTWCRQNTIGDRRLTPG